MSSPRPIIINFRREFKYQPLPTRTEPTLSVCHWYSDEMSDLLDRIVDAHFHLGLFAHNWSLTMALWIDKLHTVKYKRNTNACSGHVLRQTWVEENVTKLPLNLNGRSQAGMRLTLSTLYGFTNPSSLSSLSPPMQHSQSPPSVEFYDCHSCIFLPLNLCHLSFSVAARRRHTLKTL